MYGWDSRKTSRRCCLAWLALSTGIFSFDMITLRENQSEPIAKAIQFFQEKKPKPSLIVLPTAWGKSILTAFVAKNTDDRLLVLQPSKELLEQNYCKYMSLCGDFGTGGRLLSGIPIHDIGKYQGERIANIPLNYRQWMIRSFDWNARNEKLRQSILATM